MIDALDNRKVITTDKLLGFFLQGDCMTPRSSSSWVYEVWKGYDWYNVWNYYDV